MKFLWISAMAAVYSFAANSIDIKGLVQDYAKSPVSGASVLLVGEGLKTESNEMGAFALVKADKRVMHRVLQILRKKRSLWGMAYMRREILTPIPTRCLT